ncbi:phage holin family protein [Luteipulveratus sp. YIM 133132]|uniref:Phage holin family protein n=1 Tax=Luteipulveratus flavus TaxID=3031728 RepID=A0ABT6C1V4_9MICO|nr:MULTISPECIES: phage holin family protein [unclassified Luteipulveratus]MDE9364601.1 phage holin family protein [Luteipulveratus sp. YIM 133132]MDF8262762.1 phage holin family protein [Luteipulveratus sp. YIM 133296]
MVNFAIKTGINAVALWVAAAVISGITLVDDSKSTSSKVVTVIVVAVIFGLINAVVKPIALLISLPALILTLGLFTLIVNALMLQLLSWFSDQLNLSFHVDDFFWDAVAGALIITLVSWVLNIVIRDDD